MKIGVFGDSYADKNAGNDVWFNRLFLDYSHDVTSFGEMGSSIMFSATLIQEHFSKIFITYFLQNTISIEL